MKQRGLAPDTGVLTEKGPCKARRIRPGDHLFSALGRLVPVIKTTKQPYTGDWYEIRVAGGPSLYVAPKCLFLISLSSIREAWKPAADLLPGLAVFMPKPQVGSTRYYNRLGTLSKSASGVDGWWIPIVKAINLGQRGRWPCSISLKTVTGTFCMPYAVTHSATN